MCYVLCLSGTGMEEWYMGELYIASDKRYDHMKYNHVGKSGLKFPAVSLGF